MFERTKAYADSFLSMGIPGFDLLVYKDGKPLLRHMGGYRDDEAKTPIQGNECYWIYSCSKPITCTALLQLWEKGLFSLEDPLAKYLPEFAHMTVQTPEGTEPAREPITIRHLFTMTAGFSYDYHSPAIQKLRAHTPDPEHRQITGAIAEDPLLFQPGDQYRYGLEHDVLAILLEVLTGVGFETYVKEHVFDPLGMEHSTFRLTQAPDTLAALYSWDGQTRQRTRLPWERDRFGSRFVSGGGGCVTTVEDYMRFAEALRTGEKLLKRQTVQMMTQNQLTEHQIRTYSLSKSFGYGLGVWTPRPGHIRQDYGWGGAAGALLCVDESRSLSLVYAQHVLAPPNQALRGKLVRTFLEELEGLPPSEDIPDTKNYNLTY